MKHSIRYGTGALCLALLSAACLSCGENAETPVDTTPSVTPAETEEQTEAISPEETLSLSPELDFGGKACKFLIREAIANSEYFVEAETGDIVDDSLFRRNQAVEERLNMKFDFIPLPGEWENQDTFNGAIRASVMSNDGAYDLCGVLSNQLSKLALEGLLLNMYELPHLDFSKAWWAGGLLDELTVYDKLYFASGDASLGFLGGMMCVFFNKSLAQSFDLPDIYSIVRDGKWTLDKIVELTKDVWLDLDGDGKKSHDDRLGLAIGSWNQLYGFLDSFDLPILEKDKNGVPSEFVYGGEKVSDAVSTLVGLFKNNNAIAVEKEIDYTNTFTAGNILFCTGEFKDTTVFRDINMFDYGVVPMPKWSDDQENYYTTVRATYSGFCLPVTAADPELSAAALEAFAYESYQNVSPIYFEKALKIKYARDNETAQMFDLIKSSVTFKFATAFTMSLGDPQNFFKGQVGDLKENWASSYASQEKTFQKNLEKTLETLKELP